MSGLNQYELESFKHAGRTIRIYADPDPWNPRTDGDNLTHLACWHRRADLGDETISHMTAKEIIKRARNSGDRVLAILPLWLYDHSGMTMRAGSNRPGYPFTCQWDAGQVGWGYVLQSQAEKMGCVGPRFDQLTPGVMTEVGTWDKAALEDAIRGDVSTYDDYLTGSVYGFVIEGLDGDEIDSLWGIYAGEEGLKYVRKEACDAAEGTEDPAVVRMADELSNRVTYAGVGT